MFSVQKAPIWSPFLAKKFNTVHIIVPTQEYCNTLIPDLHDTADIETTVLADDYCVDKLEANLIVEQPGGHQCYKIVKFKVSAKGCCKICFKAFAFHSQVHKPTKYKGNYQQQNCYVFPRTRGIRTRVFCSCGGCDVHCTSPPGLGCFILMKLKVVKNVNFTFTGVARETYDPLLQVSNINEH
jgi:hypothetical protein